MSALFNIDSDLVKITEEVVEYFFERIKYTIYFFFSLQQMNGLS
jgi:hypothetical protein